MKLIGDEATLHTFNAHLKKTIKQYDVLSIDEKRKMFLQPIYQLTSSTFNMRFGYFCIQFFFIKGAQNLEMLILKIFSCLDAYKVNFEILLRCLYEFKD